MNLVLSLALLCLFTAGISSEDFDANFNVNESLWEQDWEPCNSGEDDDEYHLSDYSSDEDDAQHHEATCWYRRQHKCVKEGNCARGEMFKQETLGCVGCPSGGWVERGAEKEGGDWSLCESRDCGEGMTSHRLVDCGDYGKCSMKLTRYCQLHETCNGTYEGWKVVGGCESCRQHDVKILRKRCRYDNTTSNLCTTDKFPTIIKTQPCQPQDCVKEEKKAKKVVVTKPAEEIKWSNWSECHHLGRKNRSCLSGCPDNMTSLYHVQACHFASSSARKTPRSVAGSGCHGEGEQTSAVVILAVLLGSSLAGWFVLLIVGRRRKKRKKKKVKEDEDQHVYESAI